MKKKIFIITIIIISSFLCAYAQENKESQEVDRQGYSLSIIEDEEVALSSVPTSRSLYPVAMLIGVVSMLVLAISQYVTTCIRYRTRAHFLKAETQSVEVKVSWNIPRLKLQIRVMEDRFLDNLIKR